MPIIGGLLAGLVLIGVVLIVIIRRRSTICPSYRQGNTVTVSNNEASVYFTLWLLTWY